MLWQPEQTKKEIQFFSTSPITAEYLLRANHIKHHDHINVDHIYVVKRLYSEWLRVILYLIIKELTEIMHAKCFAL